MSSQMLKLPHRTDGRKTIPGTVHAAADFGGFAVSWGLEAMIVIGMAVLGILILPGAALRRSRSPRLRRPPPLRGPQRLDEMLTPDPGPPWRPESARGLRETAPPLTVDPVDWGGLPRKRTRRRQ